MIPNLTSCLQRLEGRMMSLHNTITLTALHVSSVDPFHGIEVGQCLLQSIDSMPVVWLYHSLAIQVLPIRWPRLFPPTPSVSFVMAHFTRDLLLCCRNIDTTWSPSVALKRGPKAPVPLAKAGYQVILFLQALALGTLPLSRDEANFGTKKFLPSAFRCYSCTLKRHWLGWWGCGGNHKNF